MRHASFFTGVGGLDLGFHRAGIETVSVSEIDPYACSVLAERFPGAPNLGNISEVNADDIPAADIWSGGFPCQDLSVAGKRAGFAGKRSSLAFTFLDLVEQRRPRWIVLENVPGLLSSAGGRDFGRLLYEMDQLRYGVAWRILDARYFGVAQRRRRVFLIAGAESDRAGEVLFECEGCERHPSPSKAQRESYTNEIARRSGISNAITGRFSKGVNTTIDEPLIISEAANASGNRATNGMARRLDDQQSVAESQKVGNFELHDFPKEAIAPAIGAKRAADMIAYGDRSTNFISHIDGQSDQDLLPVGIDSHRYRCAGNGVVAPVAEWIGRRIVEVDRRWREEAG